MKEFIEKLIERLNKELPLYASGWRKDMNEIVNQLAEEYINTSTEHINCSTGWIPCSERLPEESLNSVLGWDEYRNRCCFVQYIGGRWVLGNDIDSVKIIAWQPLPAPYQPKGE